MFRPQPDHHPAIQHFLASVEDWQVLGTAGDDLETKKPFIPWRSLDTYLAQPRRTLDLLGALFTAPGVEIPVSHEYVRQKYSRIFCILLVIGKGQFIEHFVKHDGLCDQRLPFDSRPPQFPIVAGDLQFFNQFFEQQWMLCARTFGPNDIDVRLEKERILPIICKERLTGGGSATTFKITLHEDYNDLRNDSYAKSKPGDSTLNIFVLKTYRSKDGEKYYKNEVAAFKKVLSVGSSASSIIRFYGSYVQNDTFNVLLEYANQGTLEGYFERINPPSRDKDIIDFWSSLFNVVNALLLIHQGGKHEVGGPQIFQGWHQDVKPANILLIGRSDKSPYTYQFKLADLGLSHFRSEVGEVADRDAHGTRTYGAPECCRWSDFLQNTSLKVLQNVDIWSLGAVFSEAAIWVVHGMAGLDQFRQSRKDDTAKIPRFEDRDCFHDGNTLLPAVRKVHAELCHSIRPCDYVTQKVLDELIKDLLGPSEGRPTALQLHYKSRRILEEADAKSPARAQAESIRPVRNSRTFPPQKPLTPAEVPWQAQPAAFQHSGHGEWSMPKRQDSAVLNGPDRNHSASPVGARDLVGAGHDRTFSFPTPVKTSPKSKYGALHSNHLDQELPLQPCPAPGEEVSGEEEFEESAQHDIVPDMAKPTYNRPPLDLAKGGTYDEPISRFGGKGRSNTGHTHNATKRTSQSFSPEPFPRQSGQFYLASDNGLHDPLPPRPAPVKAPNHHSPPSATSRRPAFWSVASALQWKNDKKARSKYAHMPDERALETLNQRDHVFLIDDATSMCDHWDEVIPLFGVLAYVVKDSDPDGIELYFTNSSEQHKARTTTHLLARLKQKRPEGTSDIKIKLGFILQNYMAKLHDEAIPRSRWSTLRPLKAVRPLNLYIFTDGIWTPQCDVTREIKNMVEKLEELRLPPDRVSIQFIRFGDDPIGQQRLNHLDSGLGLSLDLVDTEPANGGNVLKMLLGAIRKDFDDDPGTAHVGSSPPPHMQGHQWQ